MKNMTLVEFVKATSSKNPVPGGGSVAALCGALSAALAEMVSNLTIKNKKYIEVETDMIKVKENASVLQKTLLNDIEKDSDAFMEVMSAYKMTKSTDEEKSIRLMAIQDSLKKASIIPMNIAIKSYEVMELSAIVVKYGNKNAITDGLVCTMLSRTSVLAALLNVKINLNSIKDREFVDKMIKEVNILEKKCISEEKRILESVTL